MEALFHTNSLLDRTSLYRGSLNGGSPVLQKS